MDEYKKVILEYEQLRQRIAALTSFINEVSGFDKKDSETDEYHPNCHKLKTDNDFVPPVFLTCINRLLEYKKEMSRYHINKNIYELTKKPEDKVTKPQKPFICTVCETVIEETQHRKKERRKFGAIKRKITALGKQLIHENE